MAAQAGWYVDPKDARQYRYWDGDRWTQSTQPIPDANGAAASLFGGSAPTGTLSAGGAKDPVGANAFDGAASHPTTNEDGVLADFMWTSGLGEAGQDTSAANGTQMFAPAAPAAPTPAPAPPTTPQAVAPPVAPAPAPAPVPTFEPSAGAPPAPAGGLFTPPPVAKDRPMFGAGAVGATPRTPEAPTPAAEPALAPFDAGASFADVADDVPVMGKTYELTDDDLTVATPAAPPAPAAPPTPAASSVFEAPSAFTPPASDPDMPAFGGPPVAGAPGGSPFGAPPAAADEISPFGAPPAAAAPPAPEAPIPAAPIPAAPVMPRPNIGYDDNTRRSKVEIYTLEEDLPLVIPHTRRERRKAAEAQAQGQAPMPSGPSEPGAPSPFPMPPTASPTPSAEAFAPPVGGAIAAPDDGASLFRPPGAPAPSGPGQPIMSPGEANAAALGNLSRFDIEDEPLTKKERKERAKGKPKARKVAPMAAGGPGGASSDAPGGSTSNKQKPKSKLPVLLGILGVVVVGAAAFFLLKGGDDTTDGAEVAGTTVDRSTTTEAPAAGGDGATTAPAETTTIPETATTAKAPVTSTVPAGETLPPAEVATLQAAFDAEATRACDAIKADPGLFTEDVMVWNEAWSGIPKTYEDLQRTVNECSVQARDEAFKRIAAEEAARNGG